MNCDECKHFCSSDYEPPCCNCKGTAIPGSYEYISRPILFERNTEIESESGNDVVNHPSHYTQGGIECIDAMESAFGADELSVYCKIAAFKYIWRCEHKNGLEDVKKAIWYLDKYLELKDGEPHDAERENIKTP